MKTGQPKALKRNDLSNQSDILATERSGDQIPDAATSFQSKAAEWNCAQSSENYTQITVSQREINNIFSSLIVMCVRYKNVKQQRQLQRCLCRLHN